MKKGLPPAERDQAIKTLKCLCNGEMLRATVVKDAEYSQVRRRFLSRWALDRKFS